MSGTASAKLSNVRLLATLNINIDENMFVSLPLTALLRDGYPGHTKSSGVPKTEKMLGSESTNDSRFVSTKSAQPSNQPFNLSVVI